MNEFKSKHIIYLLHTSIPRLLERMFVAIKMFPNQAPNSGNATPFQENHANASLQTTHKGSCHRKVNLLITLLLPIVDRCFHTHQNQ